MRLAAVLSGSSVFLASRLLSFFWFNARRASAPPSPAGGAAFYLASPDNLAIEPPTLARLFNSVKDALLDLSHSRKASG